MEITVKNMVCPRCIASVTDIFEKAEVAVENITLGKIITKGDLSQGQTIQVKHALENAGFEWIDDYKHTLIERVKALIIQRVHHHTGFTSNWSDYLSEKLNQDYRYMSQLFSEIHGITIEQFILRQKIEKVKELIRYDQLTLSQIALQMHYSSTAHLSSQFKKVTGMTPSAFKKSARPRSSLDSI